MTSSSWESLSTYVPGKIEVSGVHVKAPALAFAAKTIRSAVNFILQWHDQTSLLVSTATSVRSGLDPVIKVMLTGPGLPPDQVSVTGSPIIADGG